MGYNDEDEIYYNKKKSKRNGSKRDYSRYKKSKYTHKNQESGEDMSMDKEILRIQNLQRCEECYNVYPLDIKSCPFCEGAGKGALLPTP